MQYGEAIRRGFEFAMDEDPSVILLGQGLWSPWYVGNSMTNLEKQFGYERVIDTPVSELAVTGAAIGASQCGYRPVVTHPRVDFALLAVDQIVNQAAKWNSMFGGGAPVPAVFRLIINRGGEQGAQHSQSLYSWFAHVPGLRVVVPATPQDAQDLLVAAIRCDDPVVYIDDRWLYDLESEIADPPPISLADQGPLVRRPGGDVTLVGVSWTTRLALEAADILESEGVDCEVIDLRVINPLDLAPVIESVSSTRRLVIAEGDWRSCGIAAEVIAGVLESVEAGCLVAPPQRINIVEAPAPTSAPLEAAYYPTVDDLCKAVRRTVA